MCVYHYLSAFLTLILTVCSVVLKDVEVLYASPYNALAASFGFAKCAESRGVRSSAGG
jgi:hypothetical protein